MKINIRCCDSSEGDTLVYDEIDLDSDSFEDLKNKSINFYKNSKEIKFSDEKGYYVSNDDKDITGSIYAILNDHPILDVFTNEKNPYFFITSFYILRSDEFIITPEENFFDIFSLEGDINHLKKIHPTDCDFREISDHNLLAEKLFNYYQKF